MRGLEVMPEDLQSGPAASRDVSKSRFAKDFKLVSDAARSQTIPAILGFSVPDYTGIAQASRASVALILRREGLIRKPGPTSDRAADRRREKWNVSIPSVTSSTPVPALGFMPACSSANLQDLLMESRTRSAVVIAVMQRRRDIQRTRPAATCAVDAPRREIDAVDAHRRDHPRKSDQVLGFRHAQQVPVSASAACPCRGDFQYGAPAGTTVGIDRGRPSCRNGGPRRYGQAAPRPTTRPGPSRMTSVKVPPVSTPITALGRGYDTAQSSVSR